MKTTFPIKVEVDRQKEVVAYEVELRLRAIDGRGESSLWSKPAYLIRRVYGTVQHTQ
jgi:hypothetical protein